MPEKEISIARLEERVKAYKDQCQHAMDRVQNDLKEISEKHHNRINRIHKEWNESLASFKLQITHIEADLRKVEISQVSQGKDITHLIEEIEKTNANIASGFSNVNKLIEEFSDKQQRMNVKQASLYAGLAVVLWILVKFDSIKNILN